VTKTDNSSFPDCGCARGDRGRQGREGQSHYQARTYPRNCEHVQGFQEVLEGSAQQGRRLYGGIARESERFKVQCRGGWGQRIQMIAGERSYKGGRRIHEPARYVSLDHYCPFRVSLPEVLFAHIVLRRLGRKLRTYELSLACATRSKPYIQVHP
jgi:hypothetical protein